MRVLTQFRWFLRYFGWFKVPLIGYLRPKLLELTEQKIVIKLALRPRSMNHLNSMYFGALAIGADIAGGLHGFYYAKPFKTKLSLAFKSFQAQFKKRPESDVFFVAENGETIAAMIEDSRKSGERVNKLLPVKAYTHYYEGPDLVAEFQLELSLKVL